ncbi:MAG: formylglycine-generating enzyme family protein [Steroidobacteraceae bacterium]
MTLRCFLLFLFGGFAAHAAEKAAPLSLPGAAPALGAALAPLPPCRAHASRLRSGIRVFRDCDGAPEMIALRGGRYRMGDLIGDGLTYERPAHDVQIEPVALGRFEVTNAEWKVCVTAGVCSASHFPGDDQHGRYPVAGVSWTQAKAYVDWLAARTGKPYRLPAEAEWEYAARAGGTDRYSWGSFEADACSHVNLLDASGQRRHPEWYWAERCDDHFAEAAPVGSFPPNAWGFHDMLGNVWEWVADCWHSDYSDAPADGSAWLSDSCRKRVSRGGGWGNNLRALRLSSRDGDVSDTYSDGLGFRIARTMTKSELPQGPDATPDNRPEVTEAVIAPKIPRGEVAKSVEPVSPPLLAASLAMERQMELHITVKGEQTWKNVRQHTQGTTAQDYVLSTRLRSDGVLYADNLLDPDQSTRMEIKRQYLARRGLIRLKALNGGKLPRTAEELSALSGEGQGGRPDCTRDDQCGAEAVERAAALDFLQNNSVDDLEALIAAPVSSESATWLYFFGFAGCPNHIQITSETHIAGERAYDRDRKSLVPWSLDRSASTDGNAGDRAALCQRYTATVDVRNGDVYLENPYIPSPPGTTLRSINRSIERRAEDLPVPSEVLDWTIAQLRRTRESLNISETLAANAPLDGDYTVLGHFAGELQATLTWSFKPVDGAPLAVIPAAPANP